MFATVEVGNQTTLCSLPIVMERWNASCVTVSTFGERVEFVTVGGVFVAYSWVPWKVLVEVMSSNDGYWCGAGI